MLISFSIDPEALECASSDLSVSVASHRRVIHEWRKHGVLIHADGALRDSTILKKIEGLPQECRKLWKSAIGSSRRRPSSTPWNGLFPDTNLTDLHHVSGEFELALLDSTRAVVVGGLTEHQSSRIEPTLSGMELCKLHSVSESKCFQAATHVATRAVHAGDNCAHEWKERYSRHINQADHVTVVDRYILANHNWRLSSADISGLHRLLDGCFARSKERKISVKIFCAVQNAGTALSASELEEVKRFAHDLSTRYSGGGIRTLDCHVSTDKEFAKVGHERYVRADYTIFGIDSGIDIYGGDVARKNSIVWRHDTAETSHFSQQEAALQMSAFFIKQLV